MMGGERTVQHSLLLPFSGGAGGLAGGLGWETHRDLFAFLVFLAL